jgi:hypothetical protein
LPSAKTLQESNGDWKTTEFLGVKKEHFVTAVFHRFSGPVSHCLKACIAMAVFFSLPKSVLIDILTCQSDIVCLANLDSALTNKLNRFTFLDLLSRDYFVVNGLEHGLMRGSKSQSELEYLF